MPHINVMSKREDVEYIDKIYLSDDHKVYVSLNTKTIFYEDEKGNVIKEPHPRNPGWWQMLEVLIRENERVVSSDDLYYTIYRDCEIGNFYEEELTEEDNPDKKYDIDYKIFNNQYKELIKQKFYKLVKNNGFILKKHSLKENYQGGYILSLPEQGDNILEDYIAEWEPLPPILTSTPVVYVNESDIIHREKIIEKVDNLLSSGTKNLNICGLGGIGKTSVARLLYFKYIGSGKYDHVGFIRYTGKIETSIISSMPLYQNKKSEERWNLLSNQLKNDKSSKLLIIDNVDIDKKIHQNPLSDDALQEISGWPNTSIIITSRINIISGYKSVDIGVLGDKHDISPCIDLFLHYNDKFKNEIEVIKELIYRCNYHTYAIELLAKASKNTKTLNEFLYKIDKNGYGALNSTIHTDYRNADTSVVEHIKTLFEVDRTKTDGKILTCFSILPDMEKISEEELNQWFGYSENNVDYLVAEGWINNSKGYYYIHPLIKEAVIMSYGGELVPGKFGERVLNAIESDSFLSEDDKFIDVVRKIIICESIFRNITIKDHYKQAEMFVKVGDIARKTGIRSDALNLYKEAYCMLSKCTLYGSEEKQVLLWRATYYYGYLLSYTNSKIGESEKYLREALDISKRLLNEYPNRKNMEHLSSSLDHLGYILSSQGKGMEAEESLRNAYEMRKELLDNSEDSVQMYAWTADNLGFLLSNYPEHFEESRSLLLDALEKRKALSHGQASSEVAWTLSNIASLYMRNDLHCQEAERYFKESILENQELDLMAPETHYSSLAYVYNNYGIFLLSYEDRIDDAINCFKKSIRMYKILEKKYPGSYFSEIAMVLSNISICTEKKDTEGCCVDQINSYFDEAYTLLKEYNKNHEYDSDLADICYNYWLFMIRNNVKGKERVIMRRIPYSCWVKNNPDDDDHINFFIEQSVTVELDGLYKNDMAYILFLQAGARKTRVWYDDV